MPNQYSRLTAENIQVKMNRKRNPVTSATQLAREFGWNTEYVRRTGTRAGKTESRAPQAFVNKVRSLIGDKEYKKLVSHR